MTKEEFEKVQVGDFLIEGADHLIEVDGLHPNGVSYWEGGDWQVAKIENLHFPSPRMYPQWFSVDDRLPPMDEEVIVLSTNERISFGHIVDPDVAVSHDGWNIPDVAFWRLCDYTDDMIEYYDKRIKDY